MLKCSIVKYFLVFNINNSFFFLILLFKFPAYLLLSIQSQPFGPLGLRLGGGKYLFALSKAAPQVVLILFKIKCLILLYPFCLLLYLIFNSTYTIHLSMIADVVHKI